VKWLRRAAIAGVALVLAYVALYIAMAERVEVVVLHTHDAAGDHTTRLWVTDADGRAWLRTGRENGSWLPRLRAEPAVELERGGATLPFTAQVIEDPAAIARTNQLTLEKYGWSEKLLRAMGGGSPASEVVIRLDPRQPS
jgi:hypothetical protein